MPNLGLNTLLLSLQYQFAHLPNRTYLHNQSSPSSRFQWLVAFGRKEIRFPGGPKSNILESSVYTIFEQFHNIILGVDAVYLENKALFSDRFNLQSEGKDYLDLGAYIGKQYRAEKIKLNLGVGLYLYQSLLQSVPIYTRVQVEYPIVSTPQFELQAVARLRAHYVKANTLTFGIAIGK